MSDEGRLIGEWVIFRGALTRMSNYVSYLQEKGPGHRLRGESSLLKKMLDRADGRDGSPQKLLRELHDISHNIADMRYTLPGGVYARDNPFYPGHYTIGDALDG